jgi:CRP-like cAMP-binding protein
LKNMLMCSEQKLNCHECPSFNKGIFSELSRSELVCLEKYKSLFSLKRKDTLFNENDAVRGLYCIQSGKVKLFKTTIDEKQQILNVVEPGYLLGHASLFTQRPHTFTAEALEDCEVCFWEQEGFLSILQTNASVTLKLMKQLSAALNRSEDQVLDLAYKTVRGRFSAFLLTLMKKFGVLENNAYRLDIYLSRQELSQAVGSTEETIVRLLSEFRKDGLIEMKRKCLFVINPEKLTLYTSGGY